MLGLNIPNQSPGNQTPHLLLVRWNCGATCTRTSRTNTSWFLLLDYCAASTHDIVMLCHLFLCLYFWPPRSTFPLIRRAQKEPKSIKRKVNLLSRGWRSSPSPDWPALMNGNLENGSGHWDERCRRLSKACRMLITVLGRGRGRVDRQTDGQFHTAALTSAPAPPRPPTCSVSLDTSPTTHTRGVAEQLI